MVCNKEIIEITKEKVLLAEIYKQDGTIFIDFPNQNDVQQYELYGFLDCYLTTLKKSLTDVLEETE